MTASCPVCGMEECTPIFHVQGVPSRHLRLAAQAGGGSDYGDLEVVACTCCGHVFNAGFAKSSAQDLYAVHPSTNAPVHESMLRGLKTIAGDILRDLPPRPTILEIGCGVGALARILAENATSVDLIEPNLSLNAAAFETGNIRLLPGFFPAASQGHRYDLVVCRQVLEHIERPDVFLRAIRDHLAPGGRAYIEVPSLDYIAAHASPTDFHYLHVQYFSQRMLNCLLTRAGLATERVSSIKGGHDVGVFVSAREPQAAPWPTALADMEKLRARLLTRVCTGRKRLSTPGRRLALYGACAYAQTFMGLYPDAVVGAGMFDDTDSYAGHEAYCSRARLRILQPSAELLAAYDHVVICAWVHDIAIADRLVKLNFRGSVWSLRCDPMSGRGGHPASYFMVDDYM